MKTMTRLASAILMASCAVQANAAGEAKNVIFFLGDGMGPTTVTATRIYAYGEDGKLNMESLRRTARIKTFSKDAQTTDSAPSMAAYMTGVKMNNEVISMSDDTKAFNGSTPYVNGADSTCPSVGNGTPVATLLEMAKAAGKSVGAVTTTRVTHATPAATYSHICNRDGENDIAAQAVPNNAKYNSALGTGLDVLLGGGSRHFLPTADGGKRTDATNLIDAMKAQGYTYVSKGSELKNVDVTGTTKLLGLFNKDHMNYDLDRVKNNIDEPSLAMMTEKAIKMLAKNTDKGYFLMVEGGRIDHALHGTNAKRALQDTVAFDDAIAKALSMVDLTNTLVVVTADHDHTMTMNGYSHRGNDILGNTTKYQDKSLARDVNGKPYTTLVFGNGGGARQAVREGTNLIDTKADDYLQEVGVKLGSAGSETHGGGDVMLFSGGAGNSNFKGTLDNTKVFNLVKTAMGL
ncbi:MAG: alkaline phosphatase [Moraxellaceae bacterium]|nr:alkaline phosphatase [Moraxellaceae bacterium]